MFVLRFIGRLLGALFGHIFGNILAIALLLGVVFMFAKLDDFSPNLASFFGKILLYSVVLAMLSALTFVYYGARSFLFSFEKPPQPSPTDPPLRAQKKRSFLKYFDTPNDPMEFVWFFVGGLVLVLGLLAIADAQGALNLLSTAIFGAAFIGLAYLWDRRRKARLEHADAERFAQGIDIEAVFGSKEQEPPRKKWSLRGMVIFLLLMAQTALLGLTSLQLIVIGFSEPDLLTQTGLFGRGVAFLAAIGAEWAISRYWPIPATKIPS